MPKGEVLVAGGGRRERSLGLGDGVAKQVADIVVVDLGLEAQLSLVVEQHRGCTQLDSVALLACEVEDRQ